MLFADKLRSLRESNGLPQRVVAEMLGIDIPMYSRMERGERPIRREQIAVLAKALNVKESDLLTLWLADQVADVMKDDKELINEVMDIAKGGIEKMGKLKKDKKDLTFIDLFAGIGGFHYAMDSIGGNCVFASEWDKYCRITYEENFKNSSPNLFLKDENGLMPFFNEDINDADPDKIPDFDILCGGFPCQAFSIAGLRKGFEDTRGTLFFNIANIVNRKILHDKKPKILLLENVKGLKSHMKGETLKTLLSVLQNDLKYEVRIAVLNAKYFGVPQNRERLFFVCWDKEQIPVDEFKFPLGLDSNLNSIFDKDMLNKCIPTKVSDIFEPKDCIPDKMTISDKMWIGHQERKKRNKANGKGFGYSLFTGDSVYSSTISARYWKDGSEILIDQSEQGKNPRKLTPVEAGRLQGYRIIGSGWENHNSENNQNNRSDLPEMKIVVSPKEAYHQFGNSVALPVVRTIAKEIYKQLLHYAAKSK